MSEFGDLSPTGINWQGGGVGMVEYGGGAKGQLVIFYNKPVHDPIESRATGTPRYKDVVYVRVSPPGERLNVVDRPATRDDSRRWALQWAQFEQNKDQHPEGTPIEMLYPDRPAIGQTLRANGVPTIEMCAELSGNAIDSIGMGSQTWVNAAQKWMANANKAVGINQHRRDLEERDSQIRVLNQQIELMKEEIAALRANSSQSPQLADLQRMIAQAMERPKFPQGSSAGIDVATAQINAARNEVIKAPKKAKRAKL